MRNDEDLISRKNDQGSSRIGRLATWLCSIGITSQLQADKFEDLIPVMTVVGGRVVFDAATEQSADGQ